MEPSIIGPERNDDSTGPSAASGPGRNATRQVVFPLALILLAGILSRALFLADWAENFDADEALVALQAIEIQDGLRPVYLPGQNYMGSLQSAFAALLMILFGRHANVVRIAPMIWIVAGFMVLRGLQQLSPWASHGQEMKPRPRKSGAWISLLSQWLLPPAVLFLAGIKARGGNLESLVMVLGTSFLLWRLVTQRHDRLAHTVSVGASGLLFGLAVWTHDQALLGAPLFLILLFVLARRGHWWAPILFCGASAAAYVPLWWTKLCPSLAGAPGLQGTGWAINWADLFPSFLANTPSVFSQAVTAGAANTGWIGVANLVLVTISFLALARTLLTLVKGLPHSLTRRPLQTTVLALACAGFAALIARPQYFEDAQWFRYTLFVTPLLAVSRADLINVLPRLPRYCAHALIVCLTLLSYTVAKPAWETSHPERDQELVAHLQDLGIRHVRAGWDLANRLRFLSNDQVEAVCGQAGRFPYLTALVNYHPDCYRVDRLRRDATRGRDHDAPIESLYSITARQSLAPPDSFLARFMALDERTTLFPHLEPFPLLSSGEYRRDWRGWPPRRPLALFDAIVWQSPHSDGPEVRWEAVERELDRLEKDGVFTRVASWRRDIIFVRNPPAGASRGFRAIDAENKDRPPTR